MCTKNCCSELPEGYELVKEIDAVKDKKFAVLMNVIGVVLMIAAGALLWLLRFTIRGEAASRAITLNVAPVWQEELFLLAIVLGMVLYVILHELTHGVVYKLCTHEKLTFGLSLSCAFCGVPQVFVNRRTALLSLLAPFTLYSVIFLLLVFLADGWLATLALILFALHFGGCAGDLYDTWLLLTSLRGDLLMKDTGPKQSFYIRSSERKA